MTTVNESIRHGLETAANAMRKCQGASSQAIYNELLLQSEGEGIPESVIRDVADGKYLLFHNRPDYGVTA